MSLTRAGADRRGPQILGLLPRGQPAHDDVEYLAVVALEHHAVAVAVHAVVREAQRVHGAAALRVGEHDGRPAVRAGFSSALMYESGPRCNIA
jgi:hypothetical protein